MNNSIKLGQQAALARKAGISQPHMSQCLSGIRDLSPAAAKRMSRIVNADPFDWLRGGSIEARVAAVAAWAENQ